MTASSTPAGPAAPPAETRGIESLIGRVLQVGTYAAMTLVLVGVVLMAIGGIDPLETPTQAFDPSTVIADIGGLRAAGFLWLGIVLVIGLPIGRVLLELAGAIAHRDAPMAAIAVGILVVVGIAIIVALA